MDACYAIPYHTIPCHTITCNVMPAQPQCKPKAMQHTTNMHLTPDEKNWLLVWIDDFVKCIFNEKSQVLQGIHLWTIATGACATDHTANQRKKRMIRTERKKEKEKVMLSWVELSVCNAGVISYSFYKAILKHQVPWKRWKKCSIAFQIVYRSYQTRWTSLEVTEWKFLLIKKIFYNQQAWPQGLNQF